MKLIAMRLLSIAVVFTCLALASSSVAAAQDVFQVNYFSNNVAAAPDATVVQGAPDAVVRIDNPGLTYGNLCAMIYVFNQDQQMFECCGCVETHNGLRTLSVKRDLTGNTLTGRHTTNGVIKIVSAAVNNSPCDASTNVTPKANLRSWVTHVQSGVIPPNATRSTYALTETASLDSTLGATELANLQSQCAFIGILGSGAGICSCGYGD